MIQAKQIILKWMPIIWAFMLPFYQKLSPIPLVVWGLFSLISFEKKNVTFLRGGAILSVTFFIITWYTEILNFPFLLSLKNQETQYSFLIVPLLFSLNGYKLTDFDLIKKFFIYGNAIAMSILLIRSIVLFLLEDTLKYFTDSYFCFFHQTVYTAFSLIICIILLLEWKDLFSKKQTYFLIGLFGLGIYLISNRASMVSIILVSLVYLFKNGVISGLKRSWVILFFSVLFIKNPTHNSKESFKSNFKDPRTTIWKTCMTVLNKERSFFGLGESKTRDELVRIYADLGFEQGVLHRWNSHNQYLYLILGGGIFGLAFIIFLFFFILNKIRISSENKSYYLALGIALMTELMFEKMSSRYSGVSLITFVLCVLFYRPCKPRSESAFLA